MVENEHTHRIIIVNHGWYWNVAKTMAFLPPMTGIVEHTTYKHGDDWGMVYHCFTRISPAESSETAQLLPISIYEGRVRSSHNFLKRPGTSTTPRPEMGYWPWGNTRSSAWWLHCDDSQWHMFFRGTRGIQCCVLYVFRACPGVDPLVIKHGWKIPYQWRF